MEPSLKITEEIVKQFTDRFPAFKELIEATQKASDEDTGTFRMVITTENVDRMGEVIKADGWDFENYMKNPVVLWGHDHSQLPLGVTLSIEREGGNTIATGKFAPASANPVAQQVRQLYDMKISNASSVGFIEKEREGNLITKAELIEWSFVNVPANPMALSALKAAGLSVEDLVTKGLITVKEADPVNTEEPKEPETVEPEVSDETTDEEKTWRDSVINLLNEIKTIALEASVKTQPERKEDETEDEKAYRDFNDKRKLLQDASTVISEVLAEARKSLGITR
jgi:hypothetical protein